MAGIRGALVGSILTLGVCIVIAFPLGVATAVYLEEMAPKNRFTEIIEININNLAKKAVSRFRNHGPRDIYRDIWDAAINSTRGGNSVGFDDVTHDHNLLACFDTGSSTEHS